MTEPTLSEYDGDPEAEIEVASHQLIARLHEYESVLRFYARHEHWMELGETDPQALRRLLIAMTGSAKDQHGYAYAENVLIKYAKLKP